MCMDLACLSVEEFRGKVKFILLVGKCCAEQLKFLAF